jgi:hypothetical protein
MAKEKKLEVVPIFSEVKIIGNDLHGKVEKISIEVGNEVYYDVGYWDGNTKSHITLHSSELLVEDQKLVPIGFSRS